MLTEAMTGFKLWHETKLGEELKKYLPRETCRIVIDIPADGVVKMYVDCIPPEKLLNENWKEVIGKIELINVTEKIALFKEKNEELLKQIKQLEAENDLLKMADELDPHTGKPREIEKNANNDSRQ